MSRTEDKLGNFTAQDAPTYEDVLQCMRCGFCLPTCPTFALTGRERSSPRGRVALARAVAEQQLEFTAAVKEESFFCLDCRACTTACPSGVRAGEVMEICRSQSHQQFPLGHVGKSFREFILQRMLPDPDLLEKSMLPARLYQRLGIQWLVRHSKLLKLGPAWMEKAEGMMPHLEAPLRPQLPELTPARGEQRGRVGFFLGCVMTLMYPEVSRQTVRVLAHQGFEVVTPKADQVLRRAPPLRRGPADRPRTGAVQPRPLSGAGCRLHRHRLRRLRRRRSRSTRNCSKRRPSTSKLAALPRQDPRHQRVPRRGRTAHARGSSRSIRSVTYHEPCHLCHAQGISRQPRELLRQIPGVELREMNEASWCCGSAATWGLKFSEESQQVLDRKLENVRQTGAEILVTANPGCQLQLAWGVREAGLQAGGAAPDGAARGGDAGVRRPPTV